MRVLCDGCDLVVDSEIVTPLRGASAQAGRQSDLALCPNCRSKVEKFITTELVKDRPMDYREALAKERSQKDSLIALNVFDTVCPPSGFTKVDCNAVLEDTSACMDCWRDFLDRETTK